DRGPGADRGGPPRWTRRPRGAGAGHRAVPPDGLDRRVPDRPPGSPRRQWTRPRPRERERSGVTETRRTLASVGNAARMLKQFSASQSDLGVTELAERLGLGKSTVHRLLATLTEERFVE